MFPPSLFDFSAHKNSILFLPVEGRRIGTGHLEVHGHGPRVTLLSKLQPVTSFHKALFPHLKTRTKKNTYLGVLLGG